MFAVHPLPFLSQSQDDIFVKYVHVQCDMSPIVTRYVMSSLKTLLIDTSDLGKGIVAIPTTY